jgi:membrane-bound serine protease (ClpP class)
MDAFVLIALIAVALLVAELLLPTGGVLAAVGCLGLVAAGVAALDSDSGSRDWAGPGLIALGILSALTIYFVTRKVIIAQTETPIGTGRERMVGSAAEVRTTLDPEGQVWTDGALWRARLSAAGEQSPARPGDRVVIESVDGLTLVVKQVPHSDPVEQGAT